MKPARQNQIHACFGERGDDERLGLALDPLGGMTRVAGRARRGRGRRAFAVADDESDLRVANASRGDLSARPRTSSRVRSRELPMRLS